FQFEDSGGGALGADFVEFLDDVLDDYEFVGGAGDDDAVGAGVGQDECVGGGGARPVLGLFLVQSAHRDGEFGGGSGGEFINSGVAGLGPYLAGAELSE